MKGGIMIPGCECWRFYWLIARTKIKANNKIHRFLIITLLNHGVKKLLQLFALCLINALLIIDGKWWYIEFEISGLLHNVTRWDFRFLPLIWHKIVVGFGSPLKNFTWFGFLFPFNIMGHTQKPPDISCTSLRFLVKLACCCIQVGNSRRKKTGAC